MPQVRLETLAPALLFLWYGSGQQGSVRQIPDEPLCPSCTVDATTLATLANDGLGALASVPSDIEIDSQGRIWLIPDQGVPLLYGQDGRLIGPVGREGSGPGEYVAPREVFRIADSIAIFDRGVARVTVMGPDLKALRFVTMGVSVRNYLPVIWPSLVIAAGNVPTPGAAGWPLHLITLEGSDASSVKSFGPDDGELRFARAAMHSHLLSPSDSGQFWSADRYQYRLTLWREPGAKASTFLRRPTWFSKATEYPGFGTPTVPPPPSIAAIREDSTGLLWVFTRLAAQGWQEAWPPWQPGTEIPVRNVDLHRMFRTAVEVIDPSRARVVARGFLPYWIVAALPDRRAASYAADQHGNPVVSIVRLSLANR